MSSKTDKHVGVRITDAGDVVHIGSVSRVFFRYGNELCIEWRIASFGVALACAPEHKWWGQDVRPRKEALPRGWSDMPKLFHAPYLLVAYEEESPRAPAVTCLTCAAREDWRL